MMWERKYRIQSHESVLVLYLFTIIIFTVHFDVKGGSVGESVNEIGSSERLGL